MFEITGVLGIHVRGEGEDHVCVSHEKSRGCSFQPQPIASWRRWKTGMGEK